MAESLATLTPNLTAALTQTLTFAPVDDARVLADSPNNNYGSATTLNTDNSPVENFLIKFVVSGVNGRPIASAKLRLYNVNPSDKGGDFHRVADNTWSEKSVTWNTAPVANTANLASLGSVSLNTWYEVDIASLITGDGTFSMRVTTTSSNGADYSSKEGTVGFAPQLIVTVNDSSTPTATGALTATPTMTKTPTTAATLTKSPTLGGDPVLVGAGDIASCSSAGDEATANLLDTIAGTIFTAGDNAYPDGTPTDFANCYDPSWGRHKARTRPSPGNHDYHTAGAAGYFGYFGAAAGDPAKGYYSYNLGMWHIIALNSEISVATGSTQEQWLRQDLAANPTACTLAYWHRPRFSSGSSHGSNSTYQALWQALYDYRADVVINGHDHDYERFAPQSPNGAFDPNLGIREFVVGTGGKSLNAFGTIRPNSEVRNSDTFGVLKLTLHPTGYDWQFIPQAGKGFTDVGSALCVMSGTTTPTPTPPKTSTPTNTPTKTTTPVAGTPTFTPTPTTLPGSSLTFVPDADAQMREADPTTNFGTWTTIKTDGGTGTNIESYLRFTVSGVAGTIQNATLRVYATSGTTNGPAVYSTTNTWTETGITWNTRPVRTSGAFDDKGTIAANTWVELNVTPLVTGNGTFSFVLATDVTNTDGVSFSSREGSFPPQLVVK